MTKFKLRKLVPRPRRKPAGMRSGSAVWGIAGMPGEDYPSLMLVRNPGEEVWQLLCTGDWPTDWHSSPAKKVHVALQDSCFASRGEALKAIQFALWRLED